MPLEIRSSVPFCIRRFKKSWCTRSVGSGSSAFDFAESAITLFRNCASAWRTIFKDGNQATFTIQVANQDFLLIYCGPTTGRSLRRGPCASQALGTLPRLAIASRGRNWSSLVLLRWSIFVRAICPTLLSSWKPLVSTSPVRWSLMGNWQSNWRALRRENEKIFQAANEETLGYDPLARMAPPPADENRFDFKG